MGARDLDEMKQEALDSANRYARGYSEGYEVGFKDGPNEAKVVGLNVHRDTAIFTPNGSDTASVFEAKIRNLLHQVGDLLVQKNASYGNSALDPVRIFSKGDATEQLKVRIDDKLGRLMRGNDDFDEDTVLDLIGYLTLLRVAQQS